MQTRILIAVLAVAVACLAAAQFWLNTPVNGKLEDPEMAEGGAYINVNLKKIDFDPAKWDEDEGPPLRYTLKPGETDSVKAIYKDNSSDGPFACGPGSSISFHATATVVKAVAPQ